MDSNTIKSKKSEVSYSVIYKNGEYHLVDSMNKDKTIFKHAIRRKVAAEGCIRAGLVTTANTL